MNSSCGCAGGGGHAFHLCVCAFLNTGRLGCKKNTRKCVIHKKVRSAANKKNKHGLAYALQGRAMRHLRATGLVAEEVVEVGVGEPEVGQHRQAVGQRQPPVPQGEAEEGPPVEEQRGTAQNAGHHEGAQGIREVPQSLAVRRPARPGGQQEGQTMAWRWGAFQFQSKPVVCILLSKIELVIIGFGPGPPQMKVWPGGWVGLASFLTNTILSTIRYTPSRTPWLCENFEASRWAPLAAIRRQTDPLSARRDRTIHRAPGTVPHATHRSTTTPGRSIAARPWRRSRSRSGVAVSPSPGRDRGPAALLPPSPAAGTAGMAGATHSSGSAVGGVATAPAPAVVVRSVPGIPRTGLGPWGGGAGVHAAQEAGWGPHLPLQSAQDASAPKDGFDQNGLPETEPEGRVRSGRAASPKAFTASRIPVRRRSGCRMGGGGNPCLLREKDRGSAISQGQPEHRKRNWATDLWSSPGGRREPHWRTLCPPQRQPLMHRRAMRLTAPQPAGTSNAAEPSARSWVGVPPWWG